MSKHNTQVFDIEIYYIKKINKFLILWWIFFFRGYKMKLNLKRKNWKKKLFFMNGKSLHQIKKFNLNSILRYFQIWFVENRKKVRYKFMHSFFKIILFNHIMIMIYQYNLDNWLILKKIKLLGVKLDLIVIHVRLTPLLELALYKKAHKSFKGCKLEFSLNVLWTLFEVDKLKFYLNVLCT